MEILNPYGIRDGQIIHVDDVPSGLKCNCVCPSCNSPLIARKGTKRVHHFSHANGADCHGAYETAVHLLCKELLLKHKLIRLPRFTELPSEEDEKNYVQLDRAQAEVAIGSIRADILGHKGDVPLVIEIYVWHKTGADKVQAIESMGISAMEISLTAFRKPDSKPHANLEYKLIHDPDNRLWLYNRKLRKSKSNQNNTVTTAQKQLIPINRDLTPYVPPPGICSLCKKDIEVVGWVEHKVADGTYVCRECNRKSFQHAPPEGRGEAPRP